MYALLGVCTYAQGIVALRRVKSPRTVVIADCELPVIGSGNQILVFSIAARALVC